MPWLYLMWACRIWLSACLEAVSGCMQCLAVSTACWLVQLQTWLTACCNVCLIFTLSAACPVLYLHACLYDCLSVCMSFPLLASSLAWLSLHDCFLLAACLPVWMSACLLVAIRRVSLNVCLHGFLPVVLYVTSPAFLSLCLSVVPFVQRSCSSITTQILLYGPRIGRSHHTVYVLNSM